MPRDNEEGRKEVTGTSCVTLSKSLHPQELGICSWMTGGMDMMILQVPFNFDILGL